MSPNEDSRYVTAEDIAAETGVHVATARSYFRDHGLPGRKIGHSWRTTRAAYDAWLTSPAGHDAADQPDAQPTALPPLETKDQPS